ncbi:hypothetical protein [Bacillus thuringiensis]|nr:hypothetical protein [Bacillus thuringiensis]
MEDFTKAELASMLNALVRQGVTNMVVDKNLVSATDKVRQMLSSK